MCQIRSKDSLRTERPPTIRARPIANRDQQIPGDNNPEWIDRSLHLPKAHKHGCQCEASTSGGHDFHGTGHIDAAPAGAHHGGT